MAPLARITRLEVKNYRGFRDTTMEFSHPVTVLVGENGAGKSAILRCLSLLYQDLVDDGIFKRGREERFSGADISNGADTMRCSLHFTRSEDAREEQFVWSFELRRTTGKSVEENSSAAVRDNRKSVADELCRPRVRKPPILPVNVCYWIDRSDVEAAAPPLSPEERVAQSAFHNAHAPAAAHFRSFVGWFRDREDGENATYRRRSERGHATATDPVLDAVRAAIAAFLPGFADLHVEHQRFSTPQLAVAKKAGKRGASLLSLNQLSDGERSLLAMVGDLARRVAQSNVDDLARLAPPFPAWVFIDEIELHLHPSWQRRIVPQLQKTFPGCQFVIATHSPLILADVPAAAIRVLRPDGDRVGVFQPSTETRWRDANAILEDVMDTPDRPDEARRALRKIGKLIDADRLVDAQREIDKLARLISDKDSEIVRLRSMLLFLNKP